MRHNILLNKLREGKVVFGLFNMYPAAGIIEGMCKGWDFVWIDGQHGEHSYHSILSAVQVAMAVGVESIIRVPSHEYGILGRYADLAPSAIMVPMVNSAMEAQRIVEGLYFSPLGKRSYGGRRAIDIDGREYYRERELIVVAQVETMKAVECADKIIGTDGIDCLFFSPDDMRVQLGIPVNTPTTDHPALRKAMERTAEAALRAGKFCGSVATDPRSVAMVSRMGYQLIIGGSDIKFLREISASHLEKLRQAVGSEESVDK